MEIVRPSKETLVNLIWTLEGGLMGTRFEKKRDTSWGTLSLCSHQELLDLAEELRLDYRTVLIEQSDILM